MELKKYTINQKLVHTVSGCVQSGETAMKSADPKALESEIDGLVCGLTEAEFLVVEGLHSP